jgi:hypothetical protein
VRLPTAKNSVKWIEADVASDWQVGPGDIWHDRAMFHFLTDESARSRYVAHLRQAVEPNGHVILATFGPEGPTTCSGLPVTRYSPAALGDQLGAGFRLIETANESHRTPSGATRVCYALFHRSVLAAIFLVNRSDGGRGSAFLIVSAEPNDSVVCNVFRPPKPGMIGDLPYLVHVASAYARLPRRRSSAPPTRSRWPARRAHRRDVSTSRACVVRGSAWTVGAAGQVIAADPSVAMLSSPGHGRVRSRGAIPGLPFPAARRRYHFKSRTSWLRRWCRHEQDLQPGGRICIPRFLPGPREGYGSKWQ